MNERTAGAPHPCDRRGFVLLAVLGLLGLLATMTLGVALAVGPEPLVSSAFASRLRTERAADAALRLAMQELASWADWSTAPATLRTPYSDGAPGIRPSPGQGTLDLIAETAQRTCGRPACDDAATSAVSGERPYGARNPRWRLVLHAPFADIDAVAGDLCPCYLLAWVADDPADADGDPWSDAPAGAAGHGTLWLRGAAVGPGGARAEVEALVARPCAGEGPLARCEGGIRVQSWRVVHGAIP